MEPTANLNVLSQRYATPEMNAIWSERGKILAERKLWIAVMRGQRSLGLDIPFEDIEKFERAKEDIDVEWIETRELETRHDVKARIEAFVRAAGAGEHLHRGMTSRDLTDNVEQMQIRNAARLIFGKQVSVLRHMDDRAREYRDIFLTGRTHHQAGQLTSLGRRIAMWEGELAHALPNFEHSIDRYPLRGLKGAMGTQSDMIALLGSAEKAQALEGIVAQHLGFQEVLAAPGQVYPRSLDYEMLSHLALVSAAHGNYAVGMRLMAGFDLVTEGFKEGQVGSSAMPHKMNTRSSERIWSFTQLLKMYADGASRLSGETWEEGDVSCSAVRRVVLPDAFYASDGLCETTLTVLNEMGAYPVVIEAEVDRYLPFMATSEILQLATQAGIGRETAHKLIKKHAVANALRMRQGESQRLAEDLAATTEFQTTGIGTERIHALLQDRAHFIGNAQAQIDLTRVHAYAVLLKHEAAARYEPQPIR